eukprot:CAMPEP_0119046708 /NCGR_PEP_ID=MMETSP1177-20130426/48362_1 /TAXON_ID=2985 /ORGANISM="Ochromonas sp, Strain CCMP1899" /LENGTH=252 /DNA_ID=CAMNT_0007020239 /DNA_START=175 /DNA_END=930 /DNA_ORIENTATION=+
MEASERNGSENDGSRRIDNGDGSKSSRASGKEMSHNKDDEKVMRCVSYRYSDGEAIERSESKNDRDNLADDKYDRGALVKESNYSKADEKLPAVSTETTVEITKESDSKGDKGFAAEDKCQLKYDKVPIITPTISSHADDKALPIDVPIVDVKERIVAESDGTAGSKTDDEHNLIKKENGTILDYKKHNSNDSKSDKSCISVERSQIQDDAIPIATSNRNSCTNPIDVPLYIVDIEEIEAAEFDNSSTSSKK